MHAFTNDQIDNKENIRRKKISTKSGQKGKKNEKENVQKMKDKNV